MPKGSSYGYKVKVTGIIVRVILGCVTHAVVGYVLLCYCYLMLGKAVEREQTYSQNVTQRQNGAQHHTLYGDIT